MQEALTRRGYPCTVSGEDNLIVVDNDLVGSVRYYGLDRAQLEQPGAVEHVVAALLRTEVRYLAGSEVVEHRQLLADLIEIHRAHGESTELAATAHVLRRHGLLTAAEEEWVRTSVVGQRQVPGRGEEV